MVELQAYHRGQSTPPSAQQVRSALRLLRTKRPHTLTSAASSGCPPSKSKAAADCSRRGSTSNTPPALHCLRTSACRCDRCSADSKELRLRPTSADKRLPTSVHTEAAGRTLVALSEDKGAIAPAGKLCMDRTEVRCRLEDQFADCAPLRTPPSPSPTLGLTKVGWVTAVAAAHPRPPSRSLAWEDCYDDSASGSAASPDEGEEEEGMESLASLRTQVALAAQRCKEINRLCVTELAQPDGAAETVRVGLALAAAGAHGAGATDDDDDGDGDGDGRALSHREAQLAERLPHHRPHQAVLPSGTGQYPGCGWGWATDQGEGDAAGTGHLGTTTRCTPSTTPPLPLPGGSANDGGPNGEGPNGEAPPRDEHGGGAGGQCGQWLAERILASSASSSTHRGGAACSGVSLHQPRPRRGLERGPPLHLHSPENLGPFGPAPACARSPSKQEPPPPPARTNPFEEPTNPFSPPGGGLLLSRFSPPRSSSLVLACFGELGSRGGGATARDGATPPEQRSGGHPRNPFSPGAAPACSNPFSPGADAASAASAASAAGATFAADAASATFAARVAYASTTDAYTTDDDDHVARAAASRTERERLSPRRARTMPAARKDLPPPPGDNLPLRTPHADVVAAGAEAGAAETVPVHTPQQLLSPQSCTPRAETRAAIAALDAAPRAARGATPTKQPAATTTPAKHSAVDAAKRSAERRAAAARHRDEVRKYLAVERAAVTSTAMTASFDSRQHRAELLGLTVDMTLLLCDLASEAVDRAHGAASTPDLGRQIKEIAGRPQAAHLQAAHLGAAPEPLQPSSPAPPPLDSRTHARRAPPHARTHARTPRRQRERTARQEGVPFVSDQQLEGGFPSAAEHGSEGASVLLVERELLGLSRGRSRWRLLRQGLRQGLRSAARVDRAAEVAA